MYDKRNKLSSEVENDAREYFKEKCIERSFLEMNCPSSIAWCLDFVV